MTDKPTPTTDLLKRCAEIHEWRNTGVLSGAALRDYAKRKWPDRHDTLQMAEHETVTEALALLAKWGQPAQETNGRKVFVCTHCDGVYADQPVTQCDCLPDENTFTEGWICFGAPAQPVAREQLTYEQIQDLLLCGNPTDEEMRLIRMGWDAAHGIKGGRSRYFTRCDGIAAQSTTTGQESCGKDCPRHVEVSGGRP